jgi:hypothetical protein
MQFWKDKKVVSPEIEQKGTQCKRVNHRKTQRREQTQIDSF